MKVVSVVGARPQFIKAAILSQSLRSRHREILVHTGQHYDDRMSAVFFEELGLAQPDINLGVGSGPHGQQTGAMLAGIEKVIQTESPNWVVVYGDTNSTLAGALAAAKLNVPIAHVEAGLRSFNRMMPEEINRVIADHLSRLLFCPSQSAAQNLSVEGIREGVYVVGDLMWETHMSAADRARERSTILYDQKLSGSDYVLVTIHRAENTDDPARLRRIIEALRQLETVVVFPVHPRTRKAISLLGCELPESVRMIDPVGYLDMIELERCARTILTDSGGVQKEAYWLRVPCVTLRDETEWTETLEAGWNQLSGTQTERIVSLVHSSKVPDAYRALYDTSRPSHRCVELLEAFAKE
jgi:UDP-N-acetylglucosamine 2-epimerase